MTQFDDWDDEERAALAQVSDEMRALAARHHDDPPLDLMRAARVAVLPETLNEQASQHLEHSAWGRALVDGADAAEPAFDREAQDRVLARIRRATRGERPARAWFSAWVWAPALSAAAIAIVAAMVLRRPPVNLPPPPSAPAAASTAAAAPAFRLPLEKPEVRFTATALVLRGAGASEKFTDIVAPAIRAYRAGDYAAAARDFAALQSRFPTSVEVPFYLGVSRLFLGDADGGRQALDAARRVSDDAFAPSVDWYLAVADERAGRASEAGTALERLCAGTSEYRARACEAAAQLKPK